VSDLLELLAAAGAAALEAGQAAEMKPDGSQVTAGDRAAERVLQAGLARLWPGDGFLGEEGGRAAGEATWVCDPIDGTSNFVAGLPWWGPGVARWDGTRVTDAAFLLAVQGTCWVAQDHAWRDGERLSRLPDQSLRAGDVVMTSEHPLSPSIRDPELRLRATGCGLLDLCLVADGRAAAALIGAGWEPWDVLPGLGVLDRVGGVARDLDGGPVDPFGPRVPFVVGAPRAALGLLGALAQLR